MKPGIKNELAGKVHEVKGKIKEKAGQMANDPDLEGKGIAEKIAGMVKNKVGPRGESPRQMDFFPSSLIAGWVVAVNPVEPAFKDLRSTSGQKT
jgi:uncharacterized protein YjbJ (UPF0337 family)